MKPFIPQKGHVRKPPQRTWTGKDWMDEETRRELRRKKLCYSCKEPWELGHRCMGRGKVHYIEVLSDEEDGDDETTHLHDIGQRSGEPPHLEITEQAPFQEGAKRVTIATL
jgi:hypothetical protein